MLPRRFLIFMMSASFVPNLALLTFSAQLQQKVVLIHWIPHLRNRSLTLSHLGDLIHSQPGAESAPSVTLFSLIQIKSNLVW